MKDKIANYTEKLNDTINFHHRQMESAAKAMPRMIESEDGLGTMDTFDDYQNSTKRALSQKLLLAKLKSSREGQVKSMLNSAFSDEHILDSDVNDAVRYFMLLTN